jgi:hypothetical protein
MICSKCQSDIPASARFCTNCGAQTVTDEDAKEAKDVTLPWLEAILTGLGYPSTEIKEDYLYARDHDTYPNMSFRLRGQNSFIGINSSWKVSKPPTAFQKNKFITALNAANQRGFVVTFVAYNVDKPADGIATSSFMYLGHKTAGRDIAAFIDLYSQQVEFIFKESGLLAFA